MVGNDITVQARRGEAQGRVEFGKRVRFQVLIISDSDSDS
jgi:hypothetical protein